MKRKRRKKVKAGLLKNPKSQGTFPPGKYQTHLMPLLKSKKSLSRPGRRPYLSTRTYPKIDLSKMNLSH